VNPPPVVVVGAGVGGLAAAVALAAQGLAVRVLERAPQPGGKLQPLALGGQWLDTGPTVLTMRQVFDALFAMAGERLDDHLALTPLATLARHTWPDGSRLDLHADRALAVDAIAGFAGARAARQYAAFCERTRQVFDALDAAYLQAQRPNPLSLAWHCGRRGLPGLWRGNAFSSLWRTLSRQFDDPRLRQLFGRYATYGGSSPLAAPATLMLIAHVEQAGVWSVAGGMHKLALALSGLAQRLGVQLQCGRGVQSLLLRQGRVAGLVLDDGETVAASAVIFNGDAAALAIGLLGPAARAAVPARRWVDRSLSALTWNLLAAPRGGDLLRHNLFFSGDYPAEFQALFGAGRLPAEPTVYVCAQDRLDTSLADTGAAERLLVLVNAPARDDVQPLSPQEIDRCEQQTFAHLARLGLQLSPAAAPQRRRTPADWARRYPATGGALYGQATHGWRSAFTRPAAATRLPGLWLAGGSAHPGAGLPMAALSGVLAAQALLAQRPGPTSTWAWPRAAMPGGTSTR